MELKTLDRESIVKYNVLSELSIQEILNSKTLTGGNWVSWVYYNSEELTFVPSILDEAGIYSDLRIDKPGKVYDRQAFWDLDTKAAINRLKKKQDSFMNESRFKTEERRKIAQKNYKR